MTDRVTKARLGALWVLLVGGVEALIIRLQLTRLDAAVLKPETSDRIFTKTEVY